MDPSKPSGYRNKKKGRVKKNKMKKEDVWLVCTIKKVWYKYKTLLKGKNPVVSYLSPKPEGL